MANELLLPSQEALINRLLHLACYGQQVVLLDGIVGSGKTSLLAALANELDTRNLSLVSCPQHVSAQEIRRKIVMQLLPDPLFDDDISLADTLLQFVHSLNQPVHILLDDAENLPLIVWAELLLLTELQCAGYPITVTATVSSEFAKTFQHQLPAEQRHALLPISIPTLTIAEREGLYQTLMSRSEQQTFTPRKIIVPQLEKQRGTPAEVVGLLELALNGEPDVPRIIPWPKYLAVASVLLVLFGGAGWYGYTSLQPLPEVAHSTPVISPDSQNAILQFATQILSPQNASSVPQGYELLSDGVAIADDSVSAAQESNDDSELLQDAKNVAEVKTAEVSPSEGQSSSVAEIVVAQQAPVTKSPAIKKPNTKERLPTKGYTLQVASVKHPSSLPSVLDKLVGRQVIVCRHKDWWVVLVGEFADRKGANRASKELVAKGFAEPWVRAWPEVKDYQLEKRIGDEISS